MSWWLVSLDIVLWKAQLNNWRVRSLLFWDMWHMTPCSLVDVCRISCWLLFYCAVKLGVLANSVDQNPSWQGNSRIPTHDVPSILWKPKFSLPRSQESLRANILSQMNSVHFLTFSFLKMHFNIILPSIYMLQSDLRSDRRIKFCINFFLLQCMLNSPPIRPSFNCSL